MAWFNAGLGSAGGGGGSSSHNYSTNEQVVGSWIDGSTVYEKTFFYEQASIPSQTTSVTIADLSTLSINKCIRIEMTYSITHASNGTVYWFSIRDGQIEIENTNLLFLQKATSAPSNYKNLKVVAILRYTK